MAFNENTPCFEDPNLSSCDFSPRQPSAPYSEKVYGFDVPNVSDTASEGGSLLFSRNFGIETNLDPPKSRKCPQCTTSHFWQTPIILEHSIRGNYSEDNPELISNQYRCRSVNCCGKSNFRANGSQKYITSPSLQEKFPASNEYPINSSTVPKYCCSLAKEKTTSRCLMSPNLANDCHLDEFGTERCETITRSSTVNCDINLNEHQTVGNYSPVSFQSSSPSPLRNGHQSSEAKNLDCIVEKEEVMNECVIQTNSPGSISGVNGNLPNQSFSSKKSQKPKDKNYILPKNKSASSRKLSNQMCKCCAKRAVCENKNDDGTSLPNSISSPKNAVKYSDSNSTLSNNIWEYLKEQDEKLNKLQNQISVILNEKQSFTHIDKGDCNTTEIEAETINSSSEKLEKPKNAHSQEVEIEQNFVLRYIAEHNQQIQKLQDQINLLIKRTEELESFNSIRDKTADDPEPTLISKQCQTNDLESDRENILTEKSPVIKHCRTNDLKNPSPLLNSNRENTSANEIKSPKENIVPLYESAVRNIDKLFLEDNNKDNLKSPPSKRNSQPKSTSSGAKVKPIHRSAYSPSKRKYKSRKSPLRRSSSASSNTSVDSRRPRSPQCNNNPIDSDIDEQFHESSTVSQYGLSSPFLSIATKQYLDKFNLVRRKSSSHNKEKCSSKKSKSPSYRQQFR